MAFNFPDTTGQPTDGSFIYQVAGLVYSWDGTSWVAAGAGASAVDTSVFEVVNNSPNGAGSLAYAPATGTFTFTPPDTSQYLTDYGSVYDLSDVEETLFLGNPTTLDNDILQYVSSNGRYENTAFPKFPNCNELGVSEGANLLFKVTTGNNDDRDGAIWQGIPTSGVNELNDGGKNRLYLKGKAFNHGSGENANISITLEGGNSRCLTFKSTGGTEGGITQNASSFSIWHTADTDQFDANHTNKYPLSNIYGTLTFGAQPGDYSSQTLAWNDWSLKLTCDNAGNTGAVAVFNSHPRPFSDATYDIGTNTEGFKNLYLSGNVYRGGVPMGETLQSRNTSSVTVSAMANDAISNQSITTPPGYVLYSIQTSQAAWVTLYSSSTARTNDANRSEFTDPTPGSGVLAEVITNTGTTQLITPGIFCFNESAGSGLTYAKIVNKSGFTTNMTVTLTYVQIEV